MTAVIEEGAQFRHAGAPTALNAYDILFRNQNKGKTSRGYTAM